MYRRAMAHALIAFTQAPQNVRYGRYLAIQIRNVGRVELFLGRKEGALRLFERAIGVWKQLADANPAIPLFLRALGGDYQDLSKLQRGLGLEREAATSIRLSRAALERLPMKSSDDHYLLSSACAQCAALVAKGKTSLTDKEKQEQQQENDLAMDALRKAVAAGFRNVEQLKLNEDFASLRGRADFKELVAGLEVAAKTGSLAKSADKPEADVKPDHEKLSHWEQGSAADAKDQTLRADRAAGQHAIGLIQMDVGRFEEASKSLELAVGLRQRLADEAPKNAQYKVDLTESRSALDELRRKAVGALPWKDGRLTEAARAWHKELGTLESAVAAHPGDSALARRRGEFRRWLAVHYLKAGLWQEAAQFWEVAPESTDPNDTYDPFLWMLLLAKEDSHYRQVCRAAAERFGNDRDPWTQCFLAWFWAMTEQSGADQGRALQLAEKAAAGRMTLAVDHFVFGLALFRAGKFNQAINHAAIGLQLEPDWPARIMNLPVLAMAHHRLGHVKEAQQWLRKMEAEYRRFSPLADGPVCLPIMPSVSAGWWETFRRDWPTYELLYREAARLITGSPPVEEAYDRLHSGLLHTKLGEREKAEADFQAAVALRPNDPAVWRARAQVLAKLGLKDRADADFGKAAALQKDRPRP
jgi:tetratricopeptide (TPR) repeat protein